jgi:hypothetical protein
VLFHCEIVDERLDLIVAQVHVRHLEVLGLCHHPHRGSVGGEHRVRVLQKAPQPIAIAALGDALGDPIRIFEESAIIMWDESDIIMCDVSDAIPWDVSDIAIMLEVSPAAAAGFCSPFAHPATATTAMTNAMRFMRAPSS